MKIRTPFLTANVAVAALVVFWALSGLGCSAGSSTEASRGDILTLPPGNAVDLAKKSVTGKVTIFDFYAEWCSPCALITPELERLVKERPDEVALRKVDVIGWGSEAAMHQEIEYLPYLAVVGPDGEIMAIGDDSFDYLEKEFDLDLTSILTG